MDNHNTAMGNAFAEVLKNADINQLIKTTPMNTIDTNTEVAIQTTVENNEIRNIETTVTDAAIDNLLAVNCANLDSSDTAGISEEHSSNIEKQPETAGVADSFVKESRDPEYTDTTTDDKPNTNEESYPDPEAVLQNVEDRSSNNRPKKGSGKFKPVSSETKIPQKNKAALFALSEDRPASTLLKNIFDSKTIDGVDGVDHINIHNDAETKLGRLLDMNANTPFVHPELGMFHCVGGMWHYIKTRPFIEEYRILTGAQLRRKVTSLKNESRENPNAPQTISVKGFRTIMADAMWHKVTQNAEILKLISESTLPFEHYFTQGALGIRQYPSEGFWMIEAFEEIRRVIKYRLSTGDSVAQPDFSKIETMTDPRASVDKQKSYQPRRQAPNPYGKPERDRAVSYFNRSR